MVFLFWQKTMLSMIGGMSHLQMLRTICLQALIAPIAVPKVKASEVSSYFCYFTFTIDTSVCMCSVELCASYLSHSANSSPKGQSIRGGLIFYLWRWRLHIWHACTTYRAAHFNGSNVKAKVMGEGQRSN